MIHDKQFEVVSYLNDNEANFKSEITSMKSLKYESIELLDIVTNRFSLDYSQCNMTSLKCED